MNLLIGKWDEETLFRRDQLRFYLSTHKMQYQQGSMQYGEMNHPRLWEYSTAIELSNVLEMDKRDTKILDVGGCGSLLDYYIGYNGFNLTSVDIIKDNINLANTNNKNLGYNINNKHVDITTLPFNKEFNIVFSINVVEHVMEHARKDFSPGNDIYWDDKHSPSKEEKEKEKLFIEGCVNSLKSGGLFVISYDYKTEGIYKCQPKCAYMRGPEDVAERLIVKSGLIPIAELNFDYNEWKGFEPPASTGILFLKKE